MADLAFLAMCKTPTAEPELRPDLEITSCHNDKSSTGDESSFANLAVLSNVHQHVTQYIILRTCPDPHSLQKLQRSPLLCWPEVGRRSKRHLRNSCIIGFASHDHLELRTSLPILLLHISHSNVLLQSWTQRTAGDLTDLQNPLATLLSMCRLNRGITTSICTTTKHANVALGGT